jgi:hypothetical protein
VPACGRQGQAVMEIFTWALEIFFLSGAFFYRLIQLLLIEYFFT